MSTFVERPDPLEDPRKRDGCKSGVIAERLQRTKRPPHRDSHNERVALLGGRACHQDDDKDEFAHAAPQLPQPPSSKSIPNRQPTGGLITTATQDMAVRTLFRLERLIFMIIS